MSITHCYIGRKSCGCVVAACVDDPQRPATTAEDVASFIKEGYAIERVGLDEDRHSIARCRCGI